MSYVGKVLSGGADHPVAASLYGVCSTSSNVSAKTVSLSDFDALLSGITIQVKFQYTNTASAPTLNVNGTGPYPIYTDGVNYPGTSRITSWYPNSIVSLTFDGTAWRMNDVDINAADGLTDLFNLVYPVGAIYMSVNGTNPGTIFGGTWEQIMDTFLLAAGTTYAAAATGGSATVTLDTANLPSHTHEVGAHVHGLNGHVHSVGAHSHGLNGHTHSIPSLSGSTNTSGNHGHRFAFAPAAAGYDPAPSGSTYSSPGSISRGTDIGSSGIEWNGSHSHSVTTNGGTTGGNSGSTANSSAFNTGGNSGNTANSTAFNSGATGSGTAHNNMPPYLAVYVWKRTA